MGSFSLIAVYFGRREWGLLSLILTAGIMLLFDISLIKNLSFQLSFMATLGILLANRNIKCQFKINLSDQLIFTIKENIRLTLSAQIFTLPIILYHFHKISLIAPLANLLIEWVIQPIMILGFIISIIGWIYLPLAVIPGWITWALLTYLVTIVKFLGALPYASVSF